MPGLIFDDDENVAAPPQSDNQDKSKSDDKSEKVDSPFIQKLSLATWNVPIKKVRKALYGGDDGSTS